MNRDEAQSLLVPYLDGELSADEVRALETLLAADSDLQREFHQLRDLVTRLNAQDVPQPDEHLRAGFQTMLEREKARLPSANRQPSGPAPVWPAAWWLRTAAIAALLALAVGLIWFRGGERADDEPLARNIESRPAYPANASLSRRLGWVEQTGTTTDTASRDALLDLAAHGIEASVRAAAIDALQPWTNEPAVRQQLIAMIAEERDPLAQIALVAALADGGTSETRLPMEQLLARRDVHHAVKGYVQRELRQL